MVQKYLIEKPDPSKVNKQKAIELLDKEGSLELINKLNTPRYLYWDKVKHKKMPENISPENFWYLLKQFRKLTSAKIAVKAEGGELFSWIRLPYTEEYLHVIDTHSGGQMFNSYKVISDIHKQRFMARGVVEEAIASSQLEGAHTTRKVAKRMLTEKREPKTESEKMIVNNYKTMNSIEQEYKDRELDMDALFELHAMITDGTLNPSEQYRIRNDSDKIVIQSQIGDEEYIGHVPPRKKFVEKELLRLFDYANDKDQQSFIHPVIKAIIIHFWLAYLHPFTDGNGRLARALFYWYLLRKNYWSFIYLPISTIIKKSPVQYAKAYMYSEQDDLDFTYFYDYHMRKILQAIEAFDNYVDEQVVENKRIDKLLKDQVKLNDRQKHLIHYLLSDPDSYTTVVSHSTINGVSRATAIRDIYQLERDGFLNKERSGKYVQYKPTSKLAELAGGQ